jgi:hypothetical protein
MKIQHFVIRVGPHLNMKRESVGESLGFKNNGFRPLKQEIPDDPEHEEVQSSLLASVLLSARLDVMRKNMDRRKVTEELDILLAETLPEQWHPPVEFTGGTMLHRLEKFFHLTNLHLNETADLVTASHVMHTGEKDLILKRLKWARKKAYELKRNLKLFEDEEEKEVYLLQMFIVNSLRGFSRYVAYRHFFEDFDAQKEVKTQWVVHYVCMAGVPMYLLALIFYVFLFGVSLDAATANFWFIEVSVVILLSTFIVIPMTIFIKHIAMTSYARKEILSIFKVLKIRGKTILRRSIGLMTHSHALMHHFNPACRVARGHSSLQAARLIMALNDFDIPVDSYLLEEEKTIGKRLVKVSFAPFFLLFFLTFLLPYTLQDSLIETVSVSSFNFGILSIYLLSYLEVYLPIVVILGMLFMLGMAYSLMRYRVFSLGNDYRVTPVAHTNRGNGEGNNLIETRDNNKPGNQGDVDVDVNDEDIDDDDVDDSAFDQEIDSKVSIKSSNKLNQSMAYLKKAWH